ncbi:hypothetical protein IQ268_16140 [Oculatella sp. LEGE 06141]|uniref:hypothetical protein n=1 Tax=Oculatella sp. LEGE 06141 TaxID=1828648 RepID=UPI00187EED62|nr:hypothetical protein [Oculatella sp. LEGE 06141]MBE9180102.1 hypothetical protein [Oculatella sp. LEGE 06141]
MTTFELLVRVYSLVGLLIFSIYLSAFLLDKSTPKTDIASWFVVLLGAAFWVIVLPVSLYRKLQNPQHFSLVRRKEQL